MTDTPPKINKCDTEKNGALPYKNGTRCEKIPKGYLTRAELGDFYKEILKFVMGDFKIKFFQFVSNCRCRFY